MLMTLLNLVIFQWLDCQYMCDIQIREFRSMGRYSVYSLVFIMHNYVNFKLNPMEVNRE